MKDERLLEKTGDVSLLTHKVKYKSKPGAKKRRAAYRMMYCIRTIIYMICINHIIMVFFMLRFLIQLIINVVYLLKLPQSRGYRHLAESV